MKLAALEQALRNSAGAVVADPRLVRRVIKHHRHVSGLVPHGRCYPIARRELLDLVGAEEFGLKPTDIPDPTILVARPSPRERRGRSDTEVLSRLWRAIFHARVHIALAQRHADGLLDDAEIRKRIEAIGQTEFDEVRAILRHDDQVLPPADDREVYVEFASVYLELRHFAPNLLVTTFPGLNAFELVDEALGLDVDPGPLLIEGRPQGVMPEVGPTGTLVPAGPASMRLTTALEPLEVSSTGHDRLMARADKARGQGNDVRAALLAAGACGALDPARRKRAETFLLSVLVRLGERLDAALGWSDATPKPDWKTVLAVLARRSATDTSLLRYGIEARVLYTIQRAVAAFEKEHRAVDVATWILSRGKRPIVRDLAATRELRVARSLHAALARAHYARLASADRKPLTESLSAAARRGDELARNALRPRIEGVIERVGLKATSAPERLARDKLVEELLDQCLDGGFLTFPQLRDAISRNHLKLDDLSGGQELLHGDALLKADAELAIELDGIYQRGDIYLRGLQKVSSLPFGTRIGRIIALYAVLPLGAAFVLLEGVGHIIGPLFVAVGLPALDALTLTSFLVTSAVIFGLLHSEPLRAFAMQVLELLGVLLAWVFFRIPRAILTRPAVRRWFARPAVRLVLRRVVVPTLVAVAVFYLTPLRQEDWFLGLAGALTGFAVVSGLAGTRIGRLFEDYFVEQFVPTWQVLSRQWLPGLFRLISKVFSAAMDLLQRGIYRVDEILRFQQGQHSAVTVLKAGVGLVWAMVAYVFRVYITLLVEPELNPLKHFPVVTVSHKLFLPFTPQLLAAIQIPLSPLGPIIGGAIAGVTVFLLPSASGFLAWEFKENYKLYRATLPDRLDAARIGHHGETMRGLLVAGIHSGTLPKLYERLRRTALREHEQMASNVARVADGKPREGSSIGKFREGIDQVESAIRRFVERELLAYLHASPRWRFGRLSIADVELSSNRIRIQIFCDALSPLACEITFEQHYGTIVAGMPSPGFVGVLQKQSKTCTLLFENALAGFYQRAEVDLIREQIEAELGEGAQYEVGEDGLTTWPRSDYRTELVYRVDVRRPKALEPKVHGAALAQPPRALDTRRILYRHQPISWLAWVSAWVAAEDPETDVPRLLSGTSILPRSGASLTPPPPRMRPKQASNGQVAKVVASEQSTARRDAAPVASPSTLVSAGESRSPSAPLNIMETMIGPCSPDEFSRRPPSVSPERAMDRSMPVGAVPPKPVVKSNASESQEAGRMPLPADPEAHKPSGG